MRRNMARPGLVSTSSPSMRMVTASCMSTWPSCTAISASATLAERYFRRPTAASGLAAAAGRAGRVGGEVAILHRHQRLVDAAEAVLQATDARLPARDRDRRVEVALALGVGLEGGLGAVVAVAGALLADVQLREHVEAEDEVARGVHVRTAVRRREQVVAGEHLEPGLGLR